jgi:hypothetical protein
MTPLKGRALGIEMATRRGSLMLIPLSRGGTHGGRHLKYAIIDSADYPLVKSRKWYAHWDESTKGFYAQTNVYPKGKRSGTTWLMHRVILGLKPGAELQPDHIDHVTLDNRRSNLRIVDRSLNCINRRPRNSRPGRVRGVQKRGNRWEAQIQHCGVMRYLGRFSTKEEAARAYDSAAVEIHGEHAKVNGI